MEKMREVAQDIIEIDFSEFVPEINKLFYDVMRKHGIKQCSPSGENTMDCANFEWTMCQDLFFGRVKDALNWPMLIDDVPDDLKCYDEEE